MQFVGAAAIGMVAGGAIAAFDVVREGAKGDRSRLSVNGEASVGNEPA